MKCTPKEWYSVSYITEGTRSDPNPACQDMHEGAIFEHLNFITLVPHGNNLVQGVKFSVQTASLGSEA